MKQIDQDPRGYRASPTKGEPVFVPGAIRKAAIALIFFAGVVALNIALYWLISPLEPHVRSFIGALF